MFRHAKLRELLLAVTQVVQKWLILIQRLKMN